MVSADPFARRRRPVASRVSIVHKMSRTTHTDTCLLSHTAQNRKTKVTSVTCCAARCVCVRPAAAHTTRRYLWYLFML